MIELGAICVWAMVGMALSETQTFGFGDTVRELLTNARQALEKAGWDVDRVLADLEQRRDSAVAANEAQEAAKRHQKAATEGCMVAKRHYYLGTSGYLDMTIAALGKGPGASRNRRRYRSRIRRPAQDVVLPVPVVVAPK